MFVVVLHLPPTHGRNPSMTTITGESDVTIRFAYDVLLDRYVVVVVNWKNLNRLWLKTYTGFHPQRLYRTHWPAAVIITLLLASGDIECKPQQGLYTTCVPFVKNL